MEGSLKKRKPKSNSAGKRVCSICKTTKFRSTDDGLVCRYGHKVMGVQVEASEEFGYFGGRERKRVRTEVDSFVRIPRAKRKSDQMRVIQFSLQVISRCLVEDLQFPEELEPVVRELWLLFLGHSNQELYEGYIFEANEKSSNELAVRKQETLTQLEMEERDLTPSSDSEAEVDSENDVVTVSEVEKKDKTKYKWPSLAYGDVLVFIYLACTYLKYPILLNDLIRWSRDGSIPYLDIQARLPTSVLSLDRHFSFSMSSTPVCSSLSGRAYKYYVAFTNNCSVNFPSPNIPLYLDRFCSQFYLPVEGYFYAEKMYELFSKSRHTNTSPASSYENNLITIVLMACVVSSARLLYSLNNDDADLDLASQYNTSLTKKDWLKNIQRNLRNWNTENGQDNDLQNIIKLLKQTTVINKQHAHDVDKQTMVVSLLRETERRTDIIPNRSDLFKAPSSLLAESSLSHVESLEEGLYSYDREFRSKEYEDVLQLASVIVGTSSITVIENITQALDTYV